MEAAIDGFDRDVGVTRERLFLWVGYNSYSTLFHFVLSCSLGEY